MRLDGKVALITGGGGGIGRACVELFLREGARVVVADRDEAAGEAVLREAEAAGLSCVFVPTDVSEPASVERAVETAVARFGRLDVLYNNVGGSTMQDGPVTTAPFDEFWNKIRTDLFGTWLGCHYAIPHMIANGGGSVINASSIYGIKASPGRDAYTAAKGGINALTKSMALQFAPHKVRVNAVAAGGTLTERVRKRLDAGGVPRRTVDAHLLGFVEPIQVAYAVLYLASDETLTTTGQIMAVDSGASL